MHYLWKSLLGVHGEICLSRTPLIHSLEKEPILFDIVFAIVHHLQQCQVHFFLIRIYRLANLPAILAFHI